MKLAAVLVALALCGGAYLMVGSKEKAEQPIDPNRGAQELIGTYWDEIGLRPAPELRRMGLPPKSSNASAFEYDSDPGYFVRTHFTTLLSEKEVQDFFEKRCGPVGLKTAMEEFVGNNSIPGTFGRLSEPREGVLCVGYYKDRFTTITLDTACSAGTCNVTLQMVSG